MKKLSNWQLLNSGLGLLLLLVAIGVVWLNISLIGLSYSIEDLRETLHQEISLNDKLTLEQLNLMSVQKLSQWAREFDLEKPATARIRKLRE